jgi:outer membrane protein TolC
MSRFKFIVLFLVIQFSIPAFATDSTERLDFSRALNLAFDHNPQMVQAKNLIEFSKGDLITARSLQNPEAELEFGGFKKNEDGKRNAKLSSIEIRQPFGPLGVKFLESKIASKNVKIQKEEFKAVWADVYTKVRDSYLSVLLKEKKLELAQKNLDLMRQFFNKVQLNFNSGKALKNDFQRARIELLKAEGEYLASQRDLKINRAQLNLVLGSPMETDFDIAENIQPEQLSKSLEELKSIALKQNPHIKSADLELQSAQANLAKEQLNRLPSFFLGFKRTDEGENKDYAVLGGISLPIWNLNQGEVKKAKAQKDIQQSKFEATKQEIAFDVYQAFLNADLNQKQVDLLKKSLEEADELIRLANLGYSEGEINFISYLDQVKTAVTTRVAYYEGLFNLNSSISELEKLIYASLRGEDYLK